MSSLNLNYSQEDVLEAKQRREAGEARLRAEPIVAAARKTLDAAERAVPLPYDTSSSVSSRAQLAMSDLRNQLRQIRSHSASHFVETVPQSDTEARVRGQVVVDSVNSVGSQPQAAVTANVRPLNMEAFKIARERALNGLPIIDEEVQRTDRKEAHVVINIKVRLRAGATDADVAALRQAIWASMNEGEDKKCNDFALSVSDGIATATLVIREDEADPLQDFMIDMGRELLDTSRHGDDAKAIGDSAPKLFRLVNARLELPHSLGDFFANGTDDNSWTRLTEGARFAFEAILRQDAQQLAYDKMSKQALDKYELEDIRQLLGATAANAMLRDVSLNVRLPPVELLYGMAIRDTATTLRRTEEVADLPLHVRRMMRRPDSQAEIAVAIAQHYGQTGPEARVATLIGSLLQLGATGGKIKDRIKAELARVCLEDPDPQRDSMLTIITTLVKSAGELLSVDLLSHSFNFSVEFQGFTDRIWSNLGATQQEMVDKAKPIALAFKEDEDEEGGEGKASIDSYKGKPMDPDDLRSRNQWPRGRLENLVEQVVEKELLLEDVPNQKLLGAVFQAPQPRGTFRVLFVQNMASNSDLGWTKVLKAWGATILMQEKKRGGSGDADEKGDSGEDDSDSEESPYPDMDDGNFRSAYVQLPDGRVIEFYRPPIGDTPWASMFTACDAAVIVDGIRQTPDFDTLVSKLGGFLATLTVPVLFLTTDGSAASAETQGTIPETLFTPKATKYESFSESNASYLLNWLIQQSPNQSKGTSGPISATDFIIVDPITLL